MMSSLLSQSTGRILLDSSAPLTYLNTSTSKASPGIALTHIKTSGRGEFSGCWSALLLTYSIGPPNAYYTINSSGQRHRNSNRLSLLAPSEEIRGGWDWEGESINLFIQPDYIERVLGKTFESSQIMDFMVTHKDDPFIELLMQALLSDVLAGSPNGSLPSESVVAAIIQRMQKESEDDILTSRCKSLPQQLVKQAQDYIESRLSESLHLDEIAANVGLSVRQLSRLFRTHRGCSPYGYVLHRRVNRAIGTIRTSRCSLESIAISAGFANNKHMTTCFRKVLGKTPSQFRI